MTNWNPRLGINTLNIRSTNIFNQGMDTEIADITDNAYFSITIPCYHPTEVHLSTLVLRRSVFVEPGDSIFVLIDINKPDA
ncbi:MAG: hypothetical protein PF450_15575, partial [Bacteroidales bacterium]|nr:hypothetical protein [Bacteroidales bacterium]